MTVNLPAIPFVIAEPLRRTNAALARVNLPTVAVAWLRETGALTLRDADIWTVSRGSTHQEMTTGQLSDYLLDLRREARDADTYR